LLFRPFWLLVEKSFPAVHHVLREIWQGVTPKVGNFSNNRGCGGFHRLLKAVMGQPFSGQFAAPAYRREFAADTAASTADLYYPRDLR